MTKKPTANIDGTIKLRAVAMGEYVIDAPSGPKITASKLLLGKTYLASRLYFYATIKQIGWGYVLYSDSRGGTYGKCSMGHFARKYPTEATLEEVKFIDEEELLRSKLTAVKTLK